MRWGISRRGIVTAVGSAVVFAADGRAQTKIRVAIPQTRVQAELLHEEPINAFSSRLSGGLSLDGRTTRARAGIFNQAIHGEMHREVGERWRANLAFVRCEAASQ